MIQHTMVLWFNLHHLPLAALTNMIQHIIQRIIIQRTMILWFDVDVPRALMTQTHAAAAPALLWRLLAVIIV